MGSERFEAPEAMFQPHLVDVESVGVAGAFLKKAFMCHLLHIDRAAVQYDPSRRY